MVDDSATMRRIHQKELEKLGWSVKTAVDGVDGLRVLDEMADVYLILTDVHMPNMDGIAFTACVRMKGCYTSSKIMVITSDGTLDVVEKAMNAGADDVLIKPFTPEDFVTRVRELTHG